MLVLFSDLYDICVCFARRFVCVVYVCFVFVVWRTLICCGVPVWLVVCLMLSFVFVLCLCLCVVVFVSLEFVLCVVFMLCVVYCVLCFVLMCSRCLFCVVVYVVGVVLCLMICCCFGCVLGFFVLFVRNRCSLVVDFVLWLEIICWGHVGL